LHFKAIAKLRTPELTFFKPYYEFTRDCRIGFFERGAVNPGPIVSTINVEPFDQISCAPALDEDGLFLCRYTGNDTVLAEFHAPSHRMTIHREALSKAMPVESKKTTVEYGLFLAVAHFMVNHYWK
jgi:hypothetical protein